MKTKIRLPYVFPMGSVPDGGQVTNDFLALINAIGEGVPANVTSKTISVPVFAPYEKHYVETLTPPFVVIPEDMDEWKLTKVLCSVYSPVKAGYASLFVYIAKHSSGTHNYLVNPPDGYVEIEQGVYYVNDVEIDTQYNTVKMGDFIVITTETENHMSTGGRGLGVTLTFEK